MQHFLPQFLIIYLPLKNQSQCSWGGTSDFQEKCCASLCRASLVRPVLLAVGCNPKIPLLQRTIVNKLATLYSTMSQSFDTKILVKKIIYKSLKTKAMAALKPPESVGCAPGDVWR